MQLQSRRCSRRDDGEPESPALIPRVRVVGGEALATVRLSRANPIADRVAVDLDDTAVGDSADGMWVAGLPDEASVITVGQDYVKDGDLVTAVPEEAATSPIVEYVHRWLGNDDFNATIPNRRLILISDMRQNSSQYDIYAKGGKGAGDSLAPIVQREFGPAGKDVTYDVYFLAHGHDYGVGENDVKAAWDEAFKTIPAKYDWRQVN